MSGAILVSPIMGNRKTVPLEVSAKLKKDSRISGTVFQSVLDVECATDDCERIFVPRMEGQEHCTKHRINQQ